MIRAPASMRASASGLVASARSAGGHGWPPLSTTAVIGILRAQRGHGQREVVQRAQPGAPDDDGLEAAALGEVEDGENGPGKGRPRGRPEKG